MPEKFQHDAPATAEALSKAADLEIIDSNGKAIRFGSLFEDKTTVVVFIRTYYFVRIHEHAYSVPCTYRPFFLWGTNEFNPVVLKEL